MDKELNDFFKEYKVADQNRVIPEFESLYPKKSKSLIKRYAIPLSIAATITLLLLPIYLLRQENQVASSETGGTEIIYTSSIYAYRTRYI